MRQVSLLRPQWHALFFVIGGAVLIAAGLLVTILTGLSSSSDQVFAIEALFSGLTTEIIFRKVLKKRLIFLEILPIPFFYFWPILCLYIFVFRPFEL